MATIYELEDIIKKQYELDKYDPKMYTAIKDLAEKLLVIKRITTTSEAAKTISHEYASSLYGRVCSGTEITCWTKYIILNIKRFVGEYYYSNKSVILEIPDIVDQEDFRDNYFGLHRYNYLDKIHIEDYVSTISIVLHRVVMKISRYSDVSVNRYLYLSVLCSILREDVTLIGLSSDYKSYVNFLMSICRVLIHNELSKLIKSKNLLEEAGVLSLDEMLN